MSIIQGTAKGGSTSFYDFPIENSLRFDGSSTLTRTPNQTGNLGIWTSSFWIKRSTLNSSTQSVFDARPSSSLSNSNLTNMYFKASDDSLVLGGYSSDWRETTAVYRDLSSWFHVVVSFDISTSTKSITIYVNGVIISSFTTNNNPTGTTGGYNQQNPHTIGGCCNGSASFRGYLANFQFIDGQALDQYFFGEFKDNIWVPYNAFSTAGSGTATASDGDTATDSYGTNGFRLAFESADFNWSGSSTMTDPYGSGTAVPIYGVADASGNGKHWVMNS